MHDNEMYKLNTFRLNNLASLTCGESKPNILIFFFYYYYLNNFCSFYNSRSSKKMSHLKTVLRISCPAVLLGIDILPTKIPLENQIAVS